MLEAACEGGGLERKVATESVFCKLFLLAFKEEHHQKSIGIDGDLKVLRRYALTFWRT